MLQGLSASCWGSLWEEWRLESDWTVSATGLCCWLLERVRGLSANNWSKWGAFNLQPPGRKWSMFLKPAAGGHQHKCEVSEGAQGQWLEQDRRSQSMCLVPAYVLGASSWRWVSVSSPGLEHMGWVCEITSKLQSGPASEQKTLARGRVPGRKGCVLVLRGCVNICVCMTLEIVCPVCAACAMPRREGSGMSAMGLSKTSLGCWECRVSSAPAPVSGQAEASSGLEQLVEKATLN